MHWGHQPVKNEESKSLGGWDYDMTKRLNFDPMLNQVKVHVTGSAIDVSSKKNYTIKKLAVIPHQMVTLG